MTTNDEQADFWNGAGGDAWVAMQPVLDESYAGFAAALAEAAAAAGVRRVLDVGCGAGATTIAIAARLGGGAEVTGIDISAPLIEAAKERTAYEEDAPRFLLADASAHSFGEDSFDLLTSRFGVMFFADPIAAFGELRRAIAPGGGLRFFCWRPPEENPFMTTGQRAAADLLPDLPPRRAGAPGPFAFAAPARIREVLSGAGWEGIEVEPIDLPCSFAERDLVRHLALIGPIGSALRDADDALRTEVMRVVRDAYGPFVDGDRVRFTARCWSVGAESGR